MPPRILAGTFGGVSLRRRFADDMIVSCAIIAQPIAFLRNVQALSLAVTTFFPHAWFIDKTATYQSRLHPTAAFGDAERRLVMSSARLPNSGTNMTVAATVLVPVSASSEAGLPWRIVRVDVRNLTTTVHHHFDYALDGHKREYRLHVEGASATTWTASLTRLADGARIPYEHLHSVTLIALLRMGLCTAQKEALYDKFLAMHVRTRP